MADNKQKHLELIQAIVTRLAGNSFMLKGWSVTLVAALLALGSLQNEPSFFYLVYIPIAIFWGLDGFFIWQERLFRKLYTSVAKKREDEIDFMMDTTSFQSQEYWVCSVLSKTLLPFYGVLVGSTLTVGLLST